jgi:hypothetical protein
LKRRFYAILVAAFVFTLVFACVAGAQETTPESDDGATAEPQDGTGQQLLVFAEGEEAVRAQAEEAELSGPLAGTSVGTISTDPDPQVEVITIPGPTCTAEEGASFVLQDEDGTQADFIDNENVEITLDRDGLVVTSSSTAPSDDIVPLDERGGDDVLDTGGLRVVTSTGIECEDDPDPGPDPDPDPDPDPGPDPDPDPDPGPDPDPDPTPDPTLDPEPQDEEKGPLAGGTAIGNDVLVPGDVIRTLPDGTVVFGIDQIVIETEDCELTAEGDELTITLSDRGVPFRLRDGDNVDITLEEDGTIVANGRETLGDSFPPDLRDNPDRLIIPIPVDPENDEFPVTPNDTFPIISSTGIEGEGCRVVGQSEDPDDTQDPGDNNDDNDRNDNDNDNDNDRNDNDNDNDRNDNDNDRNDNDGRRVEIDNDVIVETIPDKRLPNTGGVPMFGLAAALLGLSFIASGLWILGSVIRRDA